MGGRPISALNIPFVFVCPVCFLLFSPFCAVSLPSIRIYSVHLLIHFDHSVCLLNYFRVCRVHDWDFARAYTLTVVHHRHSPDFQMHGTQGFSLCIVDCFVGVAHLHFLMRFDFNAISSPIYSISFTVHAVCFSFMESCSDGFLCFSARNSSAFSAYGLCNSCYVCIQHSHRTGNVSLFGRRAKQKLIESRAFPLYTAQFRVIFVYGNWRMQRNHVRANEPHQTHTKNRFNCEMTTNFAVIPGG